MGARVADADLADEVFFVRFRGRQYRIRPTTDLARFIVVRKRGGYFLRADLGPSLPEGVDPDSETDAERLWWSSVFAEGVPRLRESAMRKARNGRAP